MIELPVTINIEEGLHARPAAIFVNEASKYKSDIFVKKDEKKVNAKSIMGILMLALYKGSQIIIVGDGPDEKEAVAALQKICEK